MVSYQLEGEDAIRQVSADVYYCGFPEKETYAFFEGGNPTSTDEIAVGINFAKRNHLRIGSVLHLLQKGEKKSYTVTGIYPSYRNQANSVRFFVEDIFSYFDSRMTGYYTIVLKDPRSQGRVIQDLSKKYPEFDFYPMTRSTSRTVNKMIPPVILSVCSSIAWSCISSYGEWIRTWNKTGTFNSFWDLRKDRSGDRERSAFICRS